MGEIGIQAAEQVKKQWTDKRLNKLPECANPNCNGDGQFFIAGAFWCGTCTMTYEKIKNKNNSAFIVEQIENDKKN